ncbi:MAG: toll/interleukin-1 receptor domain-containing protein [Pseudomonadota bacterium]
MDDIDLEYEAAPNIGTPEESSDLSAGSKDDAPQAATSYDYFLSYSHDDNRDSGGVCDSVFELLEHDLKLSVFRDREDMGSREKITDQVQNAIENSSAMILMIKDSIQKWPATEKFIAESFGVPVIPVLYGNYRFPRQEKSDILFIEAYNLNTDLGSSKFQAGLKKDLLQHSTRRNEFQAIIEYVGELHPGFTKPDELHQRVKVDRDPNTPAPFDTCVGDEARYRWLQKTVDTPFKPYPNQQGPATAAMERTIAEFRRVWIKKSLKTFEGQIDNAVNEYKKFISRELDMLKAKFPRIDEVSSDEEYLEDYVEKLKLLASEFSSIKLSKQYKTIKELNEKLVSEDTFSIIRGHDDADSILASARRASIKAENKRNEAKERQIQFLAVQTYARRMQVDEDNPREAVSRTIHSERFETDTGDIEEYTVIRIDNSIMAELRDTPKGESRALSSRTGEFSDFDIDRGHFNGVMVYKAEQIDGRRDDTREYCGEVDNDRISGSGWLSFGFNGQFEFSGQVNGLRPNGEGELVDTRDSTHFFGSFKFEFDETGCFIRSNGPFVFRREDDTHYRYSEKPLDKPIFV